MKPSSTTDSANRLDHQDVDGGGGGGGGCSNAGRVEKNKFYLLLYSRRINVVVICLG
jgi:hypothetical protein